MTRLSDIDWINHGLKTLARVGHVGLKAEPMATALGVSRGSFYWHFKGVRDFHNRVLDHWQKSTTHLVIKEVEQQDNQNDRLFDLMRRSFMNTKQSKLDDAIRNWARHDRSVRKRLATVDELRTSYLITLLIDSGVDKSNAASRARFLYAASLGHNRIANGSGFSVEELKDLATLLSGDKR